MRANLFLSMTLLLAATSSAQERPATLGEAFELDNPERLLYRESYSQRDDKNRVVVSYTNPKGDLIVRKILDYSSGESTPSFEQNDLRFETTLSVEMEGEELLLAKLGPDDSERERVERAVRQVIDAGFTAFIRQHWQNLTGGEAVDFRFAFVSRMQNVALRASSTRCGDTPFGSVPSDTTCFTLKLQNALFAMLVDPIYLGFDSSRKLSHYAGRSNLVDSDGDSLDVLIKYQHFD